MALWPLKGWRLDQTGEQQDLELSSGTKLASGDADPAYDAAVDKEIKEAT